MRLRDRVLPEVVLALVFSGLPIPHSLAGTTAVSRAAAPPTAFSRAAPQPLFSPRHEPPLAIETDRNVAWSQPPDVNGYKFGSEVIHDQGFDAWVADDFTLPNDTDITRVVFWGGPYLGLPGDPGPSQFNAQILSDLACVPGSLLLDLIALTPDRTFEGYDGNNDPVYRYEFQLTFQAQAGVVYWLAVQGIASSYPPLWGREQALTETGCPAMYYDAWYGGWSSCGDILGYPYDAAFALIDETGPEGGCCLADGTCTFVVARECEASGGTWLGPDYPCDPNPCFQETGACCMPDGQCVIRSVFDCVAAGGSWQGAGTTCHPNPCQPTSTFKTTWGRIKEGYR